MNEAKLRRRQERVRDRHLQRQRARETKLAEDALLERAKASGKFKQYRTKLHRVDGMLVPMTTGDAIRQVVPLIVYLWAISRLGAETWDSIAMAFLVAGCGAWAIFASVNRGGVLSWL